MLWGLWKRVWGEHELITSRWRVKWKKSLNLHQFGFVYKHCGFLIKLIFICQSLLIKQPVKHNTVKREALIITSFNDDSPPSLCLQGNNNLAEFLYCTLYSFSLTLAVGEAVLSYQKERECNKVIVTGSVVCVWTDESFHHFDPYVSSLLW